MVKARSIVGIIGNVITAGLFCSPMPTMYKIYKAKSVMEFSPDPYLTTLFNCVMWTLYGLPFVKKDNILVSTINAIGLVLELIYVCFFIVYSRKNNNNNNNTKRKLSKRMKILMWLLIEVIAFAVIVLITMFAFHLHGTRKRSVFVGVICVIFNIAMYMSPLTIMAKVMKTKSVEFMPFWLTLFSFFNGGIWLAYSLIKFDLFITIPNGLGMISGVGQLLLYAWFYNRKPSAQVEVEEQEQEQEKEEEEENGTNTTMVSKEIEMPTTSV